MWEFECVCVCEHKYFFFCFFFAFYLKETDRSKSDQSGFSTAALTRTSMHPSIHPSHPSHPSIHHRWRMCQRVFFTSLSRLRKMLFTPEPTLKKTCAAVKADGEASHWDFQLFRGGLTGQTEQSRQRWVQVRVTMSDLWPLTSAARLDDALAWFRTN